MKLKPIFEGELTEDAHNADGSLWRPKGTKLAYASTFTTRRFGDFSLLAAHPVYLILNNTEETIKTIDALERKINSSNKIVVFSKLVNGVNQYATDELLRLDPKAKQIRELDESELYTYLGKVIDCLVGLVTSIEAFVNHEIPATHIVAQSDKNGVVKHLSKVEIELYLRLEDKISELGKILDKPDYKHRKFWSDFKKIKKLRDSAVHIKTFGSQKTNRYDPLLKELFELDSSTLLKSTVDLINYFKPGYIEL